MKRNPLFIAIVAFTVVFIGGAAMAAIGSSPSATESPTVEAAASAPTTTDTKPPTDKPTDAKRDVLTDVKPKPTDKDTTPPRFSILKPENKSEVHERIVEVSGAVEEGARVFLGDQQAEQQGNRWAMEVELDEGRNRLVFKAKDAAGNYTTRTLYLYLIKPDTTPPRFSITSPRNGSETTYKVITVRGEVEEGARVVYGDKRAHVDGTKWKINVELRLGVNELKFTAVDEAGNRTSKVLTITRLKEDDKPDGPRFTITSPENKSRTDDRVILVKGGVTPGSKVYYGDQQARVDGDDWKIEVELRPGWNELSFKAIDANGNKAGASVKVYLVTEDAEYKFTANQKYGSCSEDVPYDVFYGKGKPGSVVEISSRFGNGRVEVNENGQWEIKVFFEEAPVGEKFKVLVQASTGESAEFYFVNIGGGDN